MSFAHIQIYNSDGTVIDWWCGPDENLGEFIQRLFSDLTEKQVISIIKLKEKTMEKDND